jgi:probable DNA metabolism protein
MMENSKILLYDGSFNGFLSCVYQSFEQSYEVSDLRSCREGQKSLFADMSMVETEIYKAKRVLDAIERQHYQAVKKIYFAFLSERKGIELLLYRYICTLFRLPTPGAGEHSPTLPTKIEALAALVASEKGQMEKRVSFSQEYGQLATATISPRHDVLPLLTRYLRTRNADRDWLLYDSKRHYGFYYHRQNKKCLRLSETEIHYLLQNTSYGSYVNISPSPPGLSSKVHSEVHAQSPGKESSRMMAGSNTAA